MDRRIGVGLVVLSLALGLLAVSAQAQPPKGNLSPRQRGLNYAGLNAKSGGHCEGLYRVETGKGPISCTHGPDRGPIDVDVTEQRSVADLADTATGPSSGGSVQCIGDGTGGSRVQAIYAVASDRANRAADIVPLIQGWAGQMDGAVNQSAAETGGERHLRFVTKSDCSLDVATVTLSATGDDTFANTINELQAKGFTKTDRKYLVWADAVVYCGIGQVTGGDTASSTNPANLGPNFARVDTGCWGRTDHLSELHELMHTLGAVQLSAPHTTGGYHCSDDSDVMCYPDGANVTMTFPCATSHEWLLDCNHDDYFATSPATGSYLDTHWNVANSVFLTGGSGSGGGTGGGSDGGGTTTTPTPTPTPTITTSTLTGSLSNKKPVKRFALTVGSGTAANALTFSSSGSGGGGGKGKPGGGGGSTSTPPSLQLRVLAPDGLVLAAGTGPSVLRFASTLPAGTYTWEVVGTSSVSFTLIVTYAAP